MLTSDLLINATKSIVKHFKQLSAPVNFGEKADHTDVNLWWDLSIDGPDIGELDDGERVATFYVRLVMTIKNQQNIYDPITEAMKVFSLLVAVPLVDANDNVVGCMPLSSDAEIIFEGFGAIKADSQVRQPSVTVTYQLK